MRGQMEFQKSVGEKERKWNFIWKNSILTRTQLNNSIPHVNALENRFLLSATLKSATALEERRLSNTLFMRNSSANSQCEPKANLNFSRVKSEISQINSWK